MYYLCCYKDLCRRAAVLTNKVLKHGFVTEMENILDEETTIKHDDFATKVTDCVLLFALNQH